MSTTQDPQLGQRTEQMGVAVTHRTGELAVAAMAAKQKAQVEARYVIAYNRPRSIMQARSDILAACQRPGFAESARYRKPIGNTTIDGFSIRFAEEAIKAMKNIVVESTTIYEDEEKRTVQISVTDLESNLTYGKEVTVEKTVERQKLRDGQTPLSERINSYGKKVYLVAATEDDISNKVASAESKIIRNCGLRLVPSDILEEAEAAIERTLNSGGSDPQAATKKITDSFATLNISVAELEKYLKHSIASISPKELKDLRGVYAAIKDGEASWADFGGEQAQVKTKPNLGEQSAGQATGPKPEAPLKPAEPKKKAEPAPKPEPSDNDGDLGPQAKEPTANAEAKDVKEPEPDLGPDPDYIKQAKEEKAKKALAGAATNIEQAVNAGKEPNPQVAPVSSPLTYAITDALITKLRESGVSIADFEKWVAGRGLAETFTADPVKASTDLLAATQTFRKLVILYGK